MKINKACIMISVCSILVFLCMFLPVKGSPFAFSQASRDTTIYMVVDKPASFNGNIYSWLGENLFFPQEFTDSLTYKRMIVSFVVETDGTVSSLQVLRSIHPLLDEEVIRLLKEMPKWSPAELKGKTVRSLIAIPLSFETEKQEKSNRLTYEEFRKQLELADKNNILPLDSLQLERGIEQMKKRFGNDRDAYKEIMQILDVNNKDRGGIFAFDPNQTDGFAIKIKEIESEAKAEGQRLILNLGDKDFIRKFVKASSQLERLALKKMLKLQKQLTPSEFETYYSKKFSIIQSGECYDSGCDYWCNFFHCLPILYGNKDSIYKRIVYPMYAQEHGIQGDVRVAFVIYGNGVMGGVSILSTPHQCLSKETVRVIESTRKEWIPGVCLIHHRPVSMKVFMPVHFKLRSW